MRQVARKGVRWHLEPLGPQEGRDDAESSVTLSDVGLKKEGYSLRFGEERKQKEDLRL